MVKVVFQPISGNLVLYNHQHRFARALPRCYVTGVGGAL